MYLSLLTILVSKDTIQVDLFMNQTHSSSLVGFDTSLYKSFLNNKWVVSMGISLWWHYRRVQFGPGAVRQRPWRKPTWKRVQKLADKAGYTVKKGVDYDNQIIYEIWLHHENVEAFYHLAEVYSWLKASELP